MLFAPTRTPTDSNKRSRQDNRSPTPTRNSTATPATNQPANCNTGHDTADCLIGTRLESLAPCIRTLPKILAQLIEEKSSLMLDLRHEIERRQRSVKQFDQTIKDKVTGAEKPFAPSCCRLTNPMRGSKVVADDKRYHDLVTRYDEVIALFQRDATFILRDNAKLEVKMRQKNFKHEICETLYTIANLICAGETIKLRHRNSDQPLAMNHTSHPYMGALDFINTMTDSNCEALSFKDKDDMIIHFAPLLSSQGLTIGRMHDLLETVGNNQDRTLIHSIYLELSRIFPTFTYELWKTLDNQKMEKEIMAAQLALTTNKKQEQANIAAAMLVETTQIADQTRIEQIVQAAVAKEIKKNQGSKNSKAGPKNQAPKANSGIKSNTKQKNSSNVSTEPSSTHSKKNNRSRSPSPAKKDSTKTNRRVSFQNTQEKITPESESITETNVPKNKKKKKHRKKKST